MIYLEPQLQLPAPDLRQVVADAVPPLGHVKGAPDYNGDREARAAPDLYLEAMKELGVPVKVAEEQKHHALRRRVRRQRIRRNTRGRSAINSLTTHSRSRKSRTSVEDA
jgi:hypothetical protein